MKGTHASLTTEHFNFEAYGHDRKHAERIMAQLMTVHARQRKIEFSKFWVEYSDGINYIDFEIGSGFRDYSEVVKRVA